MYGLVRPEPEVAPISTLSDWHRKGIQRLAEAIEGRETYLASLPVASEGEKTHRRISLRKTLGLILALALLIALGAGAYKARQIYLLAQVVRADLSQLREVAGSPLNPETIQRAGPLLTRSRQDLEAFRGEVEPFLWLGPRLGWVPVYGGDLAASRDILQMGSLLLESADTSLAASAPLVRMFAGEARPDPSQAVAALNRIQPDLLQARSALEQALQLRAALDNGRLSPVFRAAIEQDVDRLLPLMDDGLAAAIALPALLGAGSEGPKTYLLLVQNEDELRPTGGFITAAGTLVVQNGQVLSLSFVDSGELENWDRPYPQAPWQLEQYMNSPVLVLRDANWFPDFPTAALYAESLYAYSYSHSVDGVIAFDQHLLVMLLEALGPLQVEGAPELIDAGNVVGYMRAAKAPPAGQPAPADWNRKGFMNTITHALVSKIFQAQGVGWENIGSALFEGLEQRHLLVRLDDPALAPVIARHGWDGAMGRQAGDFLMVVDSNVGFNKTNAVVQTGLAYDVDLTDSSRPLAALTVTHHNNAATAACKHWEKQRLPGQEEYPIDDCYWNYLRVYVPAGAELLDSTPQSVPEEWMLLGHGVQGPVDVLEDELEGLQGFGALMVVPGGEARLTSFQFRLPEGVLLKDGGQTTYHLKVRKQPGTLAVPVIIRVHLPNGSTLESSVPQAVIDGNHLYLETTLVTDLDLDIRFRHE
jgi:hypothetical protein